MTTPFLTNPLMIFINDKVRLCTFGPTIMQIVYMKNWVNREIEINCY